MTSAGSFAPTDRQADGDGSYDLAKLSPKPDDVLVLIDAKTNNLAFRKVSEIASGWNVSPADFTRIGKLTVNLQHDAKPVAAAVVSIGGQSVNLAPSDKGEAAIYGLVPGKYPVKVQYRVNSVTKWLEPAPTYELSLKRENPIVTIPLTISDAVDTVDSAKPTESKKEIPKPETKEAAPKQEGSLFGRLIVYFAALAVGVSALIFGIVLLRKNQEKVQTQLDRIGVILPTDPEADPASDVPPPMPIKQPVEKIVLPDAAPAAVVAMPTPMVAANPRFVTPAGDVFMITGTAMILGREAGVDFVLPDPSISRRHAEISLVADAGSVKDLGSTNGTFVNGAKVEASPVSLKPGDTVQFGTVVVRYEV